ncbi:hypothetical protein [Xenorhabdus ishibashii]|uniref:T3SS secreted effector EspK n=1 Tax=Xenorhabdus ishibashii TaxID=1034471 RepID=A0A2D0KE42_9GAMM|nr:hypothetical protein [Xenorhabdus ishibashii]PHM61704.1 T3SS secreted effector EspK [Xenorhabdus ishibashii]
MPFHPPFIEKFKAGDLIYGLSEARINYINKNPHFRDAKDYFNENRCPPIIIDDYLIPAELEYKDFLGKYLKNKLYKDEEEKNKFLSEIKTFEAKCDFINANINTYKKYEKDFFTHLKNDNKYCNVTESHRGYNISIIGRKCKGGLSWVNTSNSELTQDIHVHFILDGIDIKRIAEKDDKNITGKELRWIFRHRNHPKVIKKVQFWENGSPTFPPWEGLNQPVWNNYVIHLEEKERLYEEKCEYLSRLFNIL